MSSGQVGRYFLAVFSLVSSAIAAGPPPGHGVHPPMPDQKYYLQCRFEDGGEQEVVEAVLEIPSLAAAADLDQVLELPAPRAPVRLKRYLPHAVLEQNIVPDKSSEARSAIRLSIEGPTQSFHRWLVSDDRERNRLISLIGTWRYMSVSDKAQRNDLLRQFKTEFTRQPKIIISLPDGTALEELPAEPGKRRIIESLGVSVKVLEFLPHFGIGPDSDKPINRSDKRLNPAVLVRIRRGEENEERWLFSKFPGFQKGDSQTFPFRLVLDCPVDTQSTVPDFILVTIARKHNEVWMRHGGRVTTKTIMVDQKAEVAGSQYTFRIARFVPSGRLVEQYRPAEAEGSVSALQVEVTDASGAITPVWLALGRSRRIVTSDGSVLLTFGPHQPGGVQDQSHRPPH